MIFGILINRDSGYLNRWGYVEPSWTNLSTEHCQPIQLKALKLSHEGLNALRHLHAHHITVVLQLQGAQRENYEETEAVDSLLKEWSGLLWMESCYPPTLVRSFILSRLTFPRKKSISYVVSCGNVRFDSPSIVMYSGLPDAGNRFRQPWPIPRIAATRFFVVAPAITSKTSLS